MTVFNSYAFEHTIIKQPIRTMEHEIEPTKPEIISTKLMCLIDLAQSNIDALRRATKTKQIDRIEIAANLLLNEAINISQLLKSDAA